MSVAGDMREGFRATLAGLTDDFTSYATPPTTPVTPCSFPYEYEVDRAAQSVTMDGTAPYQWTILILVSRADEISGHELLDDLAEAAVNAIEEDDTLGGAVSDSFVTNVATDGTREFAGTDYLAIVLTVVAR